MEYLIKIKPIEQYSFSSDISFAGLDNYKISYFVPSKKTPEQTTIFGLIRYLVLKENGVIKSNFDYTEQEKIKNSTLIGNESFDFDKKEQDFKKIKGISPLFIIDDKDNYLIKNPFCNKSKKGFEPYMLENTRYTSLGENVLLPKVGEYNPKSGYGSGYINLKTMDVIPEIFDDENKVGIFKSICNVGCRKNGNREEDGFFKKELISMIDKYSFAVFANVDAKLPTHSICYMGSYKSAFEVTIEEKENDLKNEIIKNLRYIKENNNQIWYYAYSDLLLEKNNSSSFSIIEEKNIKNIHTDLSQRGTFKKLTKTKKEYNIIKAGSVFTFNPLDEINKNLNALGYNYVVKLEGK